MAKRSKSVEKLVRLEARTRLIQGLNRLLFVLFCGAIGFVVFATAFPQRRALIDLEAKQTFAMKREQMVLAEREHRRVELRALRDDPEFLEIHARDRLDYCLEGERVLRFRRNR